MHICFFLFTMAHGSLLPGFGMGYSPALRAKDDVNYVQCNGMVLDTNESFSTD